MRGTNFHDRKTQHKRFSHPQKQRSSKTKQTTNRNIEALQKNNQRSYDYDYKNYSILKKIGEENDIEAMKFAIKNKYYDVSSAIILKDSSLLRFMIESGVDHTKYNLNDLYPEGFDEFLHYHLKLPNFDINEKFSYWGEYLE